MISDFLRPGKQNAQTMAQLMEKTGLRRRDIQRLIQDERAAGALILSDTERPGGYYLPGNREELAAFVKHMDSRARSAMLSCQAARRRLRELDAAEGQVTLFAPEASEEPQRGAE